MIYNAGNQQCRTCIEHADFECPFYGVGFSCRCSQSADAGHIKANGEYEGKSLCFGEIGRQNFGNAGCGSTGNLSPKRGAYQTSACAIEGIQNAEKGFFGDRRRTECQKRLPFQTEEHGYRFDPDTDFAKDAVFCIAAEAIGQHEKDDGYQRNDSQGAEEDIKGALEGHIENVAE